MRMWGLRCLTSLVLENTMVNHLWLVPPFVINIVQTPLVQMVDLGSISKYLGTWFMLMTFLGLILWVSMSSRHFWMKDLRKSVALDAVYGFLLDTKLCHVLKRCNHPMEALKDTTSRLSYIVLILSFNFKAIFKMYKSFTCKPFSLRSKIHLWSSFFIQASNGWRPFNKPLGLPSHNVGVFQTDACDCALLFHQPLTIMRGTPNL